MLLRNVPKEVLLADGKKYYMVNNYTYSFKYGTEQGYQWRCTSSSGCNAFIVMNGRNQLLRVSGTHAHDPPKYHVVKDGRYVQIET
ncbi:hypothetical protein PYW07_016432 [Mythimna separata]|uniref:FLYWCH-type domain-containing protein n=1 Tax=Mythimna separata TaxID=271217 RepID=A0AAD8DRJ3_MYTSE|nr:hypothetical protein PYW07_016432 [Mythimna separata]